MGKLLLNYRGVEIGPEEWKRDNWEEKLSNDVRDLPVTEQKRVFDAGKYAVFNTGSDKDVPHVNFSIDVKSEDGTLNDLMLLGGYLLKESSLISDRNSPGPTYLKIGSTYIWAGHRLEDYHWGIPIETYGKGPRTFTFDEAVEDIRQMVAAECGRALEHWLRFIVFEDNAAYLREYILKSYYLMSDSGIVQIRLGGEKPGRITVQKMLLGLDNITKAPHELNPNLIRLEDKIDNTTLILGWGEKKGPFYVRY